jgi:hypothetical protein
MPTPQDLERLRALLGQLTAIGAAQRGELIHAADWNTLVSAVEDVARAVLAADAGTAVAAHDHLDQVTSAWLSPDLRDLLERGPLSDPAMQKRLTDIEQTLRRTRESQDAASQKVEEFRGRLTDVATRDLERAAAVTSVRRAVDAVTDPRPELQNMRSSLGVIQRDMSTVLDAASRLSVGGQVVDIGSVLTRVGELEQLRDRFRLANGELLDAATIERRIAEIDTRTVSQDELDGILDSRPAVLSADQMADLETRLGGDLRGQVNDVLEGFRVEVNDAISGRLDTVDALIATRVSDSLPGLTESVITAMQPRLDAARQSAVEEAVAASQRAIDDANAGTRADVDAKLGDLSVTLTAQMQSQITQRLTAELEAMNNALATNTQRLDTLTTTTVKLEQTQNSQASLLAAIPKQMSSLRGELREMVLSEVNLRTSALARSLDEQFATFQRTQAESFQRFATEIENKLRDQTRNVAIETAQKEVRLMRTQLLAETRSIAREEANTVLRDQVRGSVDTAVRDQFAAVPGLVAAEVRRVGSTTTRVDAGTAAGGTNRAIG